MTGNSQYLQILLLRADTRMLCSMFKEFVNSLLLSPYKYLDDIEKYAQDMTKDELKFSMSKVDNLGQSAVEKYFKYINRINNTNIIGKELKTISDYNELPEDDDLKLLLQKVAILKSYQNIPDVKLFNKKNDAKTIKAMSGKVKNEARKNF